MPGTRIVIFFVCLFFALAGYGQPSRQGPTEPKKITFYYTVNWELTTQENAVFRREAYFDLNDMVFDGVYIDYHGDKMIGEGYYAHGKKTGMQTEYYEDYSVKSTIEYADGDFIIWQKMNVDKKYEVTKGTGKFSTNFFYFFDWYLKAGTMNGEFLNGKKIGTWTYYNSSKIKTDEEYYRNGKLVDRIIYTKGDSVATREPKEIILSVNALLTESLSFDKTAFKNTNQYFESLVSYEPSFGRSVSYPGGMKRLLLLLSQEVGVAEQNLSMIRLKIDEHGQVIKAVVYISIDEATDNRVLKALEIHELRFLPAMANGKPLAATIYLPISGGDKWVKLLDEMPTEWIMNPDNILN
jgi:hypothetical protein